MKSFLLIFMTCAAVLWARSALAAQGTDGGVSVSSQADSNRNFETYDPVNRPRYVLVPGVYWKRGGIGRASSSEFGREISLNSVVEEQGLFSFYGIVAGGESGRSYAEVQGGGSGWLLATIVAGIGVGRNEGRGRIFPQATVGLQFLTPVFVYLRVRGCESRGDCEREGPDLSWGIMLKVPVPLITPRDTWLTGLE